MSLALGGMVFLKDEFHELLNRKAQDASMHKLKNEDPDLYYRVHGLFKDEDVELEYDFEEAKPLGEVGAYGRVTSAVRKKDNEKVAIKQVPMFYKLTKEGKLKGDGLQKG